MWVNLHHAWFVSLWIGIRYTSDMHSDHNSLQSLTNSKRGSQEIVKIYTI